MTLILFTTQAPDPLAAQLSNYGHQVFEALAISEVLALAETYARGAPHQHRFLIPFRSSKKGQALGHHEFCFSLGARSKPGPTDPIQDTGR